MIFACDVRENTTCVVVSFCRQSEPRESERSETDWDAIIHEELPGLDFAGKKVLPLCSTCSSNNLCCV